MEIKYLNKNYLVAALEVSQATGSDVALDGLITAYIVLLVAGAEVAVHMPDEGIGHPTDSLEDAHRLIPAGWFVDAMGEIVTPISYKGDKHENKGFYAKIQHRSGGRLQEGRAMTLERAICIAAIKALHVKYAEGVQ